MGHFLRILNGGDQQNHVETSIMNLIQCVLLQSLRGESIETYACKILIKFYSYHWLYGTNCVCQN